MILKNYFRQSRSPFYSFIFILPLFIIYEFGIYLISAGDLPTIRNGADVMLRKILTHFGIHGLYGMALLFFLGITITFFLNKGKIKDLKIKSNYFLISIFESILWSLVLYIILSQGQLLLAKGDTKLFMQQLVLSIGAGIFEEFVFRVLLVSGLAFIVELFIKKQNIFKMAISITVAAAIFSIFHFFGEYADVPIISLFFIRFAAGIVLGYIYILRGFGIAAYSHSFYNILVFTQLQQDI